MKIDYRDLGHAKDGIPVQVDVERFLEGRLLISSTSGGGKSTASRQFLESTHGACPQIILDPEGEFSTLREEFNDYVLASPKGGDVLLNAQTASLLAAKVAQLNINIILDLYELDHMEKHLTVKRFIDGLLNAPKEHWGKRIVLLDEAHRFCPEKGSGASVATASVIQLMDSGRKRGLGTALATQRLSKLAKDAAAECWNKMIGPTAWNDDRIRAAEEMGMSRKESSLFRSLEPGEFMIAGRAFSIHREGVVDATKIRVNLPKTKAPQAGRARRRKTAASTLVKAVLAKIGDLPKQAQEEAKTVGELKERVRALEADLRKAQASPKLVEKIEFKNPDPGKVKKFAEEIARTELMKIKEKLLLEVGILENAYRTTMDEAGEFIKEKTDAFERKIKELCGAKIPIQVESLVSKILGGAPHALKEPYKKIGQSIQIDKIALQDIAPLLKGPRVGVRTEKDMHYNEPMLKILAFLLTQPDGRAFPLKKVGTMVGLSGTTGTFSNHITALVNAGMVTRPPGQVALADRQGAMRVTGGMEIPQGQARVDMWRKKLAAKPCQIFEVLLEQPHKTFTLVELAEATGDSTTNGKVTGTYSNHITVLSTAGLALREKGSVRLDPSLAEEL